MSLPGWTRSYWFVVAVVIVAGILNTLLAVLNTTLFLPFFFDSVFTACTGALFGWLPGLLVGLWTNVAFEIVYGFPMTMLPFAVCNMSTGLIIGLMASNGRFRTGTNATVGLLLVTASNSLLGSLIAAYLYGGITRNAAVDFVVVGLMAAGRGILSAAFIARIPANLVDKGIAVLAAFILLRFLSRRYGWPDGAKPSTQRPTASTL